MDYPNDRKYSKEHEWAKLDGEIVTVGITAHAQELLTDIVFVELPEVGDKTEQGKPICVVESVKSVSDVFAPLSGTVTEINEELTKSPELVNKDPFDKGWMIKIKVDDKSELNNLMDSEEYLSTIK